VDSVGKHIQRALSSCPDSERHENGGEQAPPNGQNGGRRPPLPLGTPWASAPVADGGTDTATGGVDVGEGAVDGVGGAAAMAGHGVGGVAAMGDEPSHWFLCLYSSCIEEAGGYLENNQFTVGGRGRCFGKICTLKLMFKI
jgi:hypothetical protein